MKSFKNIYMVESKIHRDEDGNVIRVPDRLLSDEIELTDYATKYAEGHQKKFKNQEQNVLYYEDKVLIAVNDNFLHDENRQEK